MLTATFPFHSVQDLLLLLPLAHPHMKTEKSAAFVYNNLYNYIPTVPPRVLLFQDRFHNVGYIATSVRVYILLDDFFLTVHYDRKDFSTLTTLLTLYSTLLRRFSCEYCTFAFTIQTFTYLQKIRTLLLDFFNSVFGSFLKTLPT
jgi:hypothetical protein